MDESTTRAIIELTQELTGLASNVLQKLENDLLEKYSPSQCPYCDRLLDAIYPMALSNKQYSLPLDLVRGGK